MPPIARLVEQCINEDGKAARRPTKRGVAMGRVLTMAGEDADADTVLETLLGTDTG